MYKTKINDNSEENRSCNLIVGIRNRLEESFEKNIPNNSKCLHESCPSCSGTGIRKDDDSVCIHAISCPCPKCQVVCM